MALDTTKLITFKKGLESALPKTGAIENGFYLTTDTNRLYIGTAKGTTALLNSAVKVYDKVSDLMNDSREHTATDSQYKPQLGDVAFVQKANDNETSLNALVMYNGTTWVQINTPYNDEGIRNLITAATNTANAAMPKAGGTFTGIVLGQTPDKNSGNAKALVTKEYVDAAVTGLEIGDYATKKYVDQEVGKATQAANIANTAAGNAQSIANSAKTIAERAEGKADANAKTIGTLGEKAADVVSYIDAVKATADAAAVKSVVDGQIGGLDTKITNTNTVLNGVKETAEAAMPKAGGNFTGDTLTKKGVAIATTEDVEAAKTALVGGATSKTLKAIEDAHATDMGNINSQIAEIKGNMDSLANVMNFIGVSLTDPLGENGPTFTNLDNYEAEIGDVILFDQEEYVYDGSKWVKFGAASADTAAIAALEARIKANEDNIVLNDKDIADLQKADANINSRINGVEATANAAAKNSDFQNYVTTNNAALKEVADKVNHETTGLAKTYDLASKAATQTALTNEVTARENAVKEVVDQLTWGSF